MAPITTMSGLNAAAGQRAGDAKPPYRSSAGSRYEPQAQRRRQLAEIFMLRLEAAARAAKEAATHSRFVPITLPAAKAS
jgi:hypothetical protein